MSVFTANELAFVIDDVLSPLQARAIEIHTDAELLETGSEAFPSGFAPQIMRLHPIKIIAWGLDGESRSRPMHAVESRAN